MVTKKKKKTTTNKKASVFVVPSDESSSNKNEVIYAKDGDLNKAARRGNIKITKSWPEAVGYAHKKGAQLGAEVTVHGSNYNRPYSITYSRPLRITKRMPKLR